MAAKRNPERTDSGNHASLLIVGTSSPEFDRLIAMLHGAGFETTQAENICYAEMYAQVQYFDAAIYHASLPQAEQISLARIMRVCWPWMRIIRCAHEPLPASALDAFDLTVTSESDLPSSISRLLPG